MKTNIKKFTTYIKNTYKTTPYKIYYAIGIISLLSGGLRGLSGYGLLSIILSPLTLLDLVLKPIFGGNIINGLLFGLDEFTIGFGGIFIIIGFISHMNHKSKK